MKAKRIITRSIAAAISAIILSTSVTTAFAETTNETVSVEQTTGGVSITDTSNDAKETKSDDTQNETSNDATDSDKNDNTINDPSVEYPEEKPETNGMYFDDTTSDDDLEQINVLKKNQAINSVGATIDKAATGANPWAAPSKVLSTSITLDNNDRNNSSGEYTLYNAVNNSGSRVAGTVKVYKFASGSHEGDNAFIIVSSTNLIATWTCTNASTGKGTMQIYSPTGTVTTPYYGSYNDFTSTQRTNLDLKVRTSNSDDYKSAIRAWGIWNGLRKGLDGGKEVWATAINMDKVNKISIESSVDHTSENMFRGYGSNLTNVTFSSKTKTIYRNSFRSSSAETFTFNANMTLREGSFSDLKECTSINFGGHSVSFANKGSADDSYGVFQACDKLKTVNLGSSGATTSLGTYAFSYNEKLEEFNFGKALLTKIDAYAFNGCPKLTKGKVTGATPVTDGFETNVSSAMNTDTSDSGYNTFAIPYTVQTIHEYAFHLCTKLRFVTFARTSGQSGNSQISTIKYAAFNNCPDLQYFFVPNSLKTIEGHSVVDDVTRPGAFQLNSNYTAQATSYNFYLGFKQAGSSLVTIGDRAFMRDVSAVTNSNQKSVIIYDRTECEPVNADVYNTVFKFPNCTYVGERAFANNKSLRGIFQFDYVTIAHRAFGNTLLTNLYFKWKPTDNNGTPYHSKDLVTSIIGSSDSYINNSGSRGYSDSTNTPPSGYHSLYTVLNNNTNGIIPKYNNVFSNITDVKTPAFSGTNAWNPTASLRTGTVYTAAKQKEVPASNAGKKNGTEQDDPLLRIGTSGNKTKSYLKANVAWNKPDYTQNDVSANLNSATEQIDFGYANNMLVDYVFVIDNSPSMDNATKLGENTTYKNDWGDALKGAYNLSATMNAYAQAYAISKNVLKESAGHTVTFISFSGKETGSLYNSSKILRPNNLTESNAIGMTDMNNVYKTLFQTDYSYDDGGSTNYSAGFARAYKTIQTLRSRTANNGHQQVVIFISDGNPTYYNNNGDLKDATGSTYEQIQANGVDWSAAIRDDKLVNDYYSFGSDNGGKKILQSTSTTTDAEGNPKITGTYNVHAFNSNAASESTYTTKKYETVSGLGVKIYGIIIGKGTATSAIKSVTAGDSTISDNVLASTSLTKMAERLIEIVSSSIAENYTVVIPFDNNFIYDNTKKVTVKMYGERVSDTSYDYSTPTSNYDYQEQDTFVQDISFTLSANTYYSSKAAKGRLLGMFMYDSNRNAIIWRLSTNLDKNIFPRPYYTYRMDIPLKYVGGTSGSTRQYNNKQYLAVNNNSTTSSKNGAYTMSTTTGHKFTTTSTASNYYTNAAGVYAFISAPDGVNVSDQSNITRTAESTGKMMNFVSPLYLPMGTINMVKKDADTENPLSNADFHIYRKTGTNSYEKLNFNVTSDYSGQLVYAKYAESGTANITGGGLSKYKLYNLTPGKYYIHEYKAPTEMYKFSTKTANTTVITIDGTQLNVVEVDLSNMTESEEKNLTIYNETKKDVGYVVGWKYTSTGWSYTNATYTGLGGATLGLYTNDNDNSTPVATAVSDADGKFYLKLPTTGSNSIITGTYYIKEISPPPGYTQYTGGGLNKITVTVTTKNKVGNVVCGFGSNYEQLTTNTTISATVRNQYKTYITSSAVYEEKAWDILESRVKANTATTVEKDIWNRTKANGGFVNIPTGTLRVHENSSQGHKTQTIKMTSYYTDSTGTKRTIETKTAATSGSTGYYTWTDLPLTRVEYTGSNLKFYDIYYTVEQTTNSSTYLYQEYGTSWDSATRNTSYTTRLTAADYTNVYIYNPSVRVTIANYDAANKTTPLNSTFTYNGMSTTKTATTTTNLTEEDLDLSYWITSSGRIQTYSKDITPYDMVKLHNTSSDNIRITVYRGSTAFVLKQDDVYLTPSDESVLLVISDTNGSITQGQSAGIMNDNIDITTLTNKVTFDTWYGVTSGTLYQTKVPSSYNLLSSGVNINVTDDVSNYIEKTTAAGNKYYEYNVRVYNTKTLELPPTGGNGTNIPVYVLSGLVMLLMCLAGGVVLLRPRFDFSKLR